MFKSSAHHNSLIHLAAFVVIIAGMKAASSLMVPFFLAVFLAITCAPLLFWLQNRGIPQLIGLLLILAVVAGIWVLLVIFVGSSLGDFSRNVPYYQERLTILTKEGLSWLSAIGLPFDATMLEEIFNPGKIMKMVAGTLNGLSGMLKNAFLIMLTFIFLLLEASGIPYKIKAIRGNSEASLSEYVAITEGVNRYLAIKTMTSLTTGGIVFSFLHLQGVDFAILWALIAFLLNFIPNIGSIIAAIPAILLSLVQLGPSQAILTAIGFLFVNVVVGSIVEPRIMGKGIGLSTLVVFLSLTFWGWVLGPIGMLLSVPLTMTVKIALGNSESTRWISILLGSNKEVLAYLQRRDIQ